MKEVYILRHANWNGSEDTLLPEGIQNAKKYSKALPKFTIVYASPFNRTRQTAELLSGMKAQVSDTASIPNTPPHVRSQILEQRDTHPLGIAGALFENDQAQPALKTAGDKLVGLIKAILETLDKDESGLIVSHDGTMMATQRILSNISLHLPLKYNYGELEGFKVNENLQIEEVHTSAKG